MKFTIITGASSGIGYELSKLFSRNGHNLVLVSRQAEKLKQIANELSSEDNILTEVIPIDLSRPDSATELCDQIRNKSISVNFLVNNAGFYVKGAFSETPWEREKELIQLQCLNQIQMVKLLLPDMLKSGEGGILNVCSTGSYVPGPYNTIYCAAKSFLLSFSEALAEELKGSGVHVTALCPGGTRTSFQDFSKRKNNIYIPLMDPSKVAQKGYHGFMKGKRIVIPGLANKMQVFIIRFLPAWVVTNAAARIILNELKIESP